jgi:hypothetical protein
MSPENDISDIDAMSINDIICSVDAISERVES